MDQTRINEHLRKTASVIKIGYEFKEKFHELYQSLLDLDTDELHAIQIHPDSQELQDHMNIVDDFMQQAVGMKPYKYTK
jgi:hypothetical protein